MDIGLASAAAPAAKKPRREEEAGAKQHVKWGVIGCAGIAAKTCEGMLEAAGATCVAVGSRSREKAEAFAQENCPGARAFGSYQEVLDDPEVQVVYIPLPTGLKHEWVLKAAKARKHVLCEKPLASTARESQEMVEECAKAGVQFMDNTMFMHHDRTHALSKALGDEATLGGARQVTSAFTIPFGNDPEWARSNIRMSAASEPLGCMGDLGWYNIRLTQLAFDYADPEAVCCDVLAKTEEGVPTYCIATMKFPGGRVGRFDCSFIHPIREWGEIVGSKATVKLSDFVVCGEKEKASYTVSRIGIGPNAVTFPEAIETAAFSGPGCVQHTRLIEKMSELVASGKLDPFWPKVSLQTQSVMFALLASAERGGAWVDPAEQR